MFVFAHVRMREVSILICMEGLVAFIARSLILLRDYLMGRRMEMAFSAVCHDRARSGFYTMTQEMYRLYINQVMAMERKRG